MTATSRTAKLLATTAAIALHGLALWGVSGTTEIEIEGSSGAAEASLGNSFADMAALLAESARDRALQLTYVV